MPVSTVAIDKQRIIFLFLQKIHRNCPETYSSIRKIATSSVQPEIRPVSARNEVKRTKSRSRIPCPGFERYIGELLHLLPPEEYPVDKRRGIGIRQICHRRNLRREEEVRLLAYGDRTVLAAQAHGVSTVQCRGVDRFGRRHTHLDAGQRNDHLHTARRR